MKSWLTKFRLSATLDSDRSASPSRRRGLADSEETRRFDETIRSLDHALRNQPPASGAQPDLHSAIMEAVRASRGTHRNSAATRQWVLSPRWLPAPALATLALLGLWWTLHRPPNVHVHEAETAPAPILQIASALEAGDNAARSLPPAVVAPLSDELGRVNLDLENAAHFLLASLP
jgi:hypothetical protein